MNHEGGYRFLPGSVFCSKAVAAEPGYGLVHAEFEKPLDLDAGFERIQKHLDEAGRPRDALSGLDIRMPAPVDVQDFLVFNADYIARLDAWDLRRDGHVPTTRTNVAPVADPPGVSTLSGFTYTVHSDAQVPTFLVSGVAELPDGESYPEGLTRFGETTPDAIADKARTVIDLLAGITADLAVTWDPATEVHVYSAHESAATAGLLVAAHGVAPARGVTWHRTYPPVTHLELEIDLRRFERAERL
ncbi:2-amino-5-chloromuconate deaminase CnbZ [Actinomadura roseirufa]|uniref:2-amino-5-chloromuconate deaminase CnbZ n=1 Tax=Actinomadura roseirufa TaxID=2094049 RepID=UPI0013F15C57|nr:hypothetical protein [Actinomadura roseirufa]